MFPLILMFQYFVSFIVLSIVFVTGFIKYREYSYAKKHWDKIPGPKPRFKLFGNLDLFRIKGLTLPQSSAIVYHSLGKLFDKEGIYKLHFGIRPSIILFRQHTVQSILSSNVNINKSWEYNKLNDWLGNGLIASGGQHWKSRRRLLTPAFHFKILDDFIPIINKQTDILIEKLRKDSNKPFIDIRDPIEKCTLDLICETAMGVSIGAQFGQNSEYINAVHYLSIAVIERLVSPWLWPDFIFNKTSIGRKYKSNLNILHSMTRNVIKERKEYLLSINGESNETENDEQNIYFPSKKKRRMAFLDLLLDHHIKDNSLSLEDIGEEVSNFMFAGHDTTALSLSWALYLLGRHPEVQVKAQQELDQIFGDNRQRNITSDDIKQMHYIECIIKETLRLYPSAPGIGRTLSEDIKCGDYLIPKGTEVYIQIHILHSDPQVFPDPIRFKPERFLSMTTTNIDAYSYLPFSAGPRSCIGQKLAIIEQKIILAKILLNFNLESLDPRDKIILSQEMVYRSTHALRIKLIPRL